MPTSEKKNFLCRRAVRLFEILYDVVALGHAFDAVFWVYQYGDARLTADLLDFGALAVRTRNHVGFVVESEFVQFVHDFRAVGTAAEFVQFEVRHVRLWVGV